MFFKGLSGLTSMWSQDMAIDLGTANTLVVLKDQGIDHVFELKWDGYMYSGKFLDFDITCQYKVEQDFSSSKQTVTGVEKFTRKKSGYPKN